MLGSLAASSTVANTSLLLRGASAQGSRLLVADILRDVRGVSCTTSKIRQFSNTIKQSFYTYGVQRNIIFHLLRNEMIESIAVMSKRRPGPVPARSAA